MPVRRIDLLANEALDNVVADIAEVLVAFDADRCLVAGWSGVAGTHWRAGRGSMRPPRAMVIAGVVLDEAEGLEWMAGMGEENVAEFGAADGGEQSLAPYSMRRESISRTSRSMARSPLWTPCYPTSTGPS